ncbi:protein of unknown function DUF3506 containing protein [Nitzschia inconspicua]|uniref:Uncharacterized protein n=1 Tax=Nitzschia inconspicua TaxID=303405 RepID=A0A9K3K8R3_9STRA|nr:protein of unknown function DUF3506 containing protein [Nitzschia inconspicua]KAG7357411.1 protein of unknown function DUF3506 containing protein [Nitzschia inconspicua]
MITTPLSNRILLCCIGAVVVVSAFFGHNNGRFVPSVHAFTSFHSHRQISSTSSSFSLQSTSSFFDDGSTNFDDHNSLDHSSRRRTEFTDLGSVEESLERQRRIQQEERNGQRFVKYGDDLWALRNFMTKLSHKLLQAIQNGMRDDEKKIREQLRQIEQQDPEFVYKTEMEQLKLAKMEGRDFDARKHSRNAYAARSCLPQFNLEGLWVGKYGHHGYEMINVTYHGDLLVAYKVTGDKNVPRGEITFQVDLSPVPPRIVGSSGGGDTLSSSFSGSSTVEPLQPITLTEKAAKKWGTTQLPRHKGLGQVAETGFTNNQWMDGQLIIIGEEYFSFAWVPIEQQIFFGRPSPELALKMLRESGATTVTTGKTWDQPPSMDDDVAVLKQFVASCLEKTTETVEEDLNGDPFSCIWTGSETEECYFQ